MRTIEQINGLHIGIGSLGKNNLEKAKILVCKALNLDDKLFEERYSDFFNGFYYKYDNIMIYSNIDFNNPYYEQEAGKKKFRVICKIDTQINVDKIIEYYNSICIKGKPVFL